MGIERILLDSVLTVGKVPDYNGKEFGKLQLVSQKLAQYVGQKAKIKVIVQIEVDDMETGDKIEGRGIELERQGCEMK